MQLRKLQSSLKEIEATGGQVVVISYDSADTLRRVAAKREVTFLLLSDPGSKTIDAYAMRDKESENGSANHATFIIDQKGIIREKPLVLNFSDRPAIDALVNALKAAKNEKEDSKP